MRCRGDVRCGSECGPRRRRSSLSLRARLVWAAPLALPRLPPSVLCRAFPPAGGVRGAKGPMVSCPAVPGLYDLMLVLDPNAPEQSQNEVLRNVESMVESGGSLVGRHDWGVRRMAFEIDHRPDAAYHLFQFET